MVSQCIVWWQSGSCAQWLGVPPSTGMLLLVVAVAGAVIVLGSTSWVVMVNILQCSWPEACPGEGGAEEWLFTCFVSPSFPLLEKEPAGKSSSKGKTSNFHGKEFFCELATKLAVLLKMIFR